MQVYTMGNGSAQSDLSSYRSTENYLIVADFGEVEGIREALGIAGPMKKGSKSKRVDDFIRFESNDGYDYVGFVSFELRDSRFSFERVGIYYGRNFLLFVTKDEKERHEGIVEDLKAARSSAGDGKEELAFLYYRVFNGALSRMFDSLSRYEETLGGMEVKILTSPGRDDFEKIVRMKGMSFRLKKCLRLLLLVGDELGQNENRLVPAKLVKSFRHLDSKINRLYEFAEGIHEMSEHLMDLYDSTVTSRTNNLLGKLTIITVFATPLTVITGVYGMNFVNMPELQNRYGYFIVLGVMAVSISLTYLALKKLKVLK